jgi:hypothetical protein
MMAIRKCEGDGGMQGVVAHQKIACASSTLVQYFVSCGAATEECPELVPFNSTAKSKASIWAH